MDRIDELENALSIHSAKADHIRVDDARRLTGPGLLWDKAGAVMDVFFDQVDPAQITDLWDHHARWVLNALGWQAEAVTHRSFTGGVNLAISAPMDQLYSAIFAAMRQSESAKDKIQQQQLKAQMQIQQGIGQMSAAIVGAPTLALIEGF